MIAAQTVVSNLENFIELLEFLYLIISFSDIPLQLRDDLLHVVSVVPDDGAETGGHAVPPQRWWSK